MPRLLPTHKMIHSLSLCRTGSQGRLTLRDHVGLCDHVVEEGQHLDHLLVLLSVGQLAGTEESSQSKER